MLQLSCRYPYVSTGMIYFPYFVLFLGSKVNKTKQNKKENPLKKIP